MLGIGKLWRNPLKIDAPHEASSGKCPRCGKVLQECDCAVRGVGTGEPRVSTPEGMRVVVDMGS
jgi:hypothetical protein